MTAVWQALRVLAEIMRIFLRASGTSDNAMIIVSARACDLMGFLVGRVFQSSQPCVTFLQSRLERKNALGPFLK
jgi:hypothetical protein